MNKAVIAACMGLLVVAGCSNKKPAGTDAGMTPPPPPSVISPAPEPMPMAPAPAPTMVTPAPAPAKEAAHAKAPAPKATHVAKAESSTGKKVYVVQKGDNLSKIAKHYKTTVAKLMKANPKIKPDGKILVGQKINIP